MVDEVVDMYNSKTASTTNTNSKVSVPIEQMDRDEVQKAMVGMNKFIEKPTTFLSAVIERILK